MTIFQTMYWHLRTIKVNWENITLQFVKTKVMQIFLVVLCIVNIFPFYIKKTPFINQNISKGFSQDLEKKIYFGIRVYWRGRQLKNGFCRVVFSFGRIQMVARSILIFTRKTVRVWYMARLRAYNCKRITL